MTSVDDYTSIEVDASNNHKHSCARKYQKRMREKKRECVNEKKNLEDQYTELVREIRDLRLRKRNVDKKVHKLEKLKKQKKRMKKIAIAYGLSEYKEKFGVPLLDLVNTLIESAKITREIVGEGNLKFLLNLFTTLYNIYKNPDWDVLMVNMTNFFVNYFPQKYADMAMAWFKTAFEVAFSQDDKVSWKQYILSIFEDLGNVLGDQMWNKVLNFSQKFASFMVRWKISFPLIPLIYLQR